LNSIYADAFLDIDDLFAVTTPPSRVNLVADPVAIVKTRYGMNLLFQMQLMQLIRQL